MADFDALLRRPNLGQPCLVQTPVHPPEGTTFSVLFAGFAGMDLKAALQGKLFLQRLADTHQVLQERIRARAWTFQNTERWRDKWDIHLWPDRIKEDLIPLEVVTVEAPVESAWRGAPIYWSPVGYPFEGPALQDRDFTPRFFIDYTHAYSVTLRIPAGRIRNLEIPQLFNLIQAMPEERAYNIGFHAVYLHNKDWEDFSFVHATDTHVAWRNDFISGEIEKATGNKPAAFANFNDNFRRFIGCANVLHRQGDLDFILATGDLVDHVEIRKTFVGIWDHFRYPWENFTVLRDLLVGWSMIEGGEIVGEELEVPLFTLLGNHDYRPSEYPLIATYELWGGIDLYTSEQYGAFFLGRDEALAYESGPSKEMPYYSQDDGLRDQSHYAQAPWRYRAILNPDLDYVIPLGRHRLVALDSGPDKGEFTGLMDAVGWYDSAIPVGSRYDLVHSTPDSEGFSTQQVEFLEEQIKGVAGTVVVACHSPHVNYRRVPPPHLFRESERCQLSADDVADLRAILYADEYFGWELEIWKAIAQNPNLVPAELADYTFDVWAKENGWCFGTTSYFKKGTTREPDLGRGVPDEHFSEFLSAIMPRRGDRKNVELLLSGHTHRSIEYRARWMGEEILFWHDYYFDNTVGGRSPDEYWRDPQDSYPSPLNAYWNRRRPAYLELLNESGDARKWWQDHSPVFVQTVSVAAPPPSGEMGIRHVLVRGGTIVRIGGSPPAAPRRKEASQPWFTLAGSPP